jgi:hypothetical protein
MQTIKCSPPYALIDVIRFEFPAVCRSEMEIPLAGLCGMNSNSLQYKING